MGTPNDPLTFFVLEAGDCLERLDGVLASAGPGGPDGAEFVRYARTLRGAAVVHKLTGFADLATGVERAGRALRDRAIHWSPGLAAALVAAVDDLKILLHNLRIWGPNEEARAKRRLADLLRFVPAPEESSEKIAAGSAYLAQEMTETAAVLEPLVRPGSSASGSSPALQAALARVRAVRGVAAVHDLPPIPEVLDAVERVARSLEVGHAAPTAAQTTLIAAAAALLRRTSGDLRALGRSVAGTPEERRYTAAYDALSASVGAADRIVPIDELFYGDGATGVVAPTASPPTTSAERFRLEVVSHAEHLRALVREAQSAPGGVVSDRTANELRRSLENVRGAAESFGERDIADFLTTFTAGHPAFDFLTLHALDELADLLADPSGPDRDLAERMATLARGRAVDSGIGEGMAASLDPAPTGLRGTGVPSPASAPPAARRPAPAPLARERARTPTGRALQALLADGIAGISPLDDLPLSELTPPRGGLRSRGATPPASPANASTNAGGGVGSDVPVVGPRASDAPPPTGTASAGAPGSDVSIDALLYRGTAALARARALRDELRAQSSPTSGTLAELYDLLDLAASS